MTRWATRNINTPTWECNTSFIHFTIFNRSYRCTSRELLINKHFDSSDRLNFWVRVNLFMMDIDCPWAGAVVVAAAPETRELTACWTHFPLSWSGVVINPQKESFTRSFWDCRDAACMLRRQIDSRANKTRPKDRSCLVQVLYFGFGLNVKIWRSKREWRDDSGDSLKVQQETKTRWWSSRSELCGQSKETRKAPSHVTSHYTVNYILKTIYQH